MRTGSCWIHIQYVEDNDRAFYNYSLGSDCCTTRNRSIHPPILYLQVLHQRILNEVFEMLLDVRSGKIHPPCLHILYHSASENSVPLSYVNGNCLLNRSGIAQHDMVSLAGGLPAESS